MTPSTSLTIVRPQKDLAPLEFDLSIAYEAERQIQAIASAGSGNALYLASVFGRAYASLGRIYGEIYCEVGKATVQARKRRAQIILDEAPAIAKAKGLASPRSPCGAEDIREAICYQDEDYCKIEEYRAALEAAKELVFIKLQSMRMCHDAVKSIMRGTEGSAGGKVYDTGSTREDVINRALDHLQKVDPIEPKRRATEEDLEKGAQEDIKRRVYEEKESAPKKRGWGEPRF
jgi:hypothetical protein